MYFNITLKLLFLVSRLKMFTKYHDCFLSNRFFYFPFQNKQTEPIRFHYHACHAVRSSVCAFFHSFIHSCIHAFIYLSVWLRYTLISLSKFLHHNVVAIIRPTQLITVQSQQFLVQTPSEDNFGHLAVLMVVLPESGQAACYLFLCSFHPCLSASDVLLCKNPALV